MKLLIIEDDPVISASLARGLTAEGFVIETAFDGVDGLWKATEGAYDLVILDIMLPKKNGFEVCRELRSAGCDVPILMLTAKDGHLDEAEGLDTGADDYLVKPFSFEVLVARIRALLRRSATRAMPISAGPVTLDTAARRVFVDGVELVITTREFDLLEYLARRPGQAVTKLAIAAGIWPDDFDGDLNIVEVYVGRLRRKIEARTARVVISTVRGVGYRFEDT